MGKHTINWREYPPLKECTDMGDTNGNVIDIEIKILEDVAIHLEKDDCEKEKHIH